MVKKAQHTLEPDRKIWIYSAHDETIGNLLMTLNVFDPHPPPYAAVVLIELRTNSKNQYFVTVRILFNSYVKHFIQFFYFNIYPFFVIRFLIKIRRKNQFL